MNSVRVKFQDWKKRLNLWMHKFKYEIYQNPAEAFGITFLLFIFLFELVILMAIAMK